MTIGLGNVRIKGRSGRTYSFRAYPLGTQFASIGAVYFITSRSLRQDGKTAHKRLYCGQTADLSDPENASLPEAAVLEYDANCICVLPSEDESRRLEIEEDIIQNYNLLAIG